MGEFANKMKKKHADWEARDERYYHQHTHYFVSYACHLLVFFNKAVESGGGGGGVVFFL